MARRKPNDLALVSKVSQQVGDPYLAESELELLKQEGVTPRQLQDAFRQGINFNQLFRSYNPQLAGEIGVGGKGLGSFSQLSSPGSIAEGPELLQREAQGLAHQAGRPSPKSPKKPPSPPSPPSPQQQPTLGWQQAVAAIMAPSLATLKQANTNTGSIINTLLGNTNNPEIAKITADANPELKKILAAYAPFISGALMKEPGAALNSALAQPVLQQQQLGENVLKNSLLYGSNYRPDLNNPIIKNLDPATQALISNAGQGSNNSQSSAYGAQQNQALGNVGQQQGLSVAQQQAALSASQPLTNSLAQASQQNFNNQLSTIGGANSNYINQILGGG